MISNNAYMEERYTNIVLPSKNVNRKLFHL